MGPPADGNSITRKSAEVDAEERAVSSLFCN